MRQKVPYKGVAVKRAIGWLRSDHPILPSLVLISLISIGSNLLVSFALVIAFHSISNQTNDGMLESIAGLLQSGPLSPIEPGLVLMVAIGVLVASGNLTAQLETRVLKTQLLARASELNIVVERKDRQAQSGYLATLRPLYGSLFSLASEVPKTVVFAFALLAFFGAKMWVWVLLALAATAWLARFSFIRGRRVFSQHRAIRKNETSPIKELAESLISIESNAATLPVSTLLTVMALSLTPLAGSWLISGDVLGGGSTWIPIWVLYISSLATVTRLSAVVGVSVVRYGEFRVVGGSVQKVVE